MKMLNVLLLAICFLLTARMPAQTQEPKKENSVPVKSNQVQSMAYQLDGRALDERFVELFSSTNRNKGYKGTPYLFEEWKMGSLIKTGGDTIPNLELAYDVYEGELICQVKNAKAVLLDPGQVHSFFMRDGEEQLYYERHLIDGASRFLRTYPLGKGFNIYALQSKTVRQANNTPYGTSQYHEYVDKPEILYLRLGEGAPLQKVERNKKKFLELMGEYAGEVERYMKIEGLKQTKLEDLKKLIAYVAQVSQD